MLSNLRTSTKLTLAFGMLIAGFAGLLFMAQSSLQEIQAKQQTLFNEQVPRELAIRELRGSLDAVRADLLAMTMSADAQQHAGFESSIQRHSAAQEEIFRQLLAYEQGDAEAPLLLRELQGLWQAFSQTRDREIIPAIRAGQIDQARPLILGIQTERVAKIRELGQRLTALMQQQTAAQLRDGEATLERQRRLFLGFGGLLVALTALFAWALSRDLARPLNQLTGWAEQISRGVIPHELGFTERGDEVGLLGQAFARMGRYLQALAGKAERLARGELPEDTAAVSEHDVLGQAFARTGQYFQTLAGKAERLARGELLEDAAPVSERDVLGQAFARTGQYFQALAGKAESLARGELHEEVRPASERDVLGRAFAAMIGNLRALVQELHEGISVLA
ncbi:MAG: HAMP domain-containing protein, partial [Pseudomonas sp.]